MMLRTRNAVQGSLVVIVGVSLLLALAGMPADTRAAAKGKLVLAWHAGISAVWLDPQENISAITPYNFAYALHDALVKPMPGNLHTPALAEQFEVGNDFKTATFVLRKGIKFHHGDPVTPADVKFTFEHYRGGQAKVLHEKTERIELVDDRTIRFHFKEPFLDFMAIYGTPGSGAGWIVPAKYYQQVGQDAFKQKPIGAGPYKLVRQQPGVELEFEAFEDYYRPVHVKTLIMKAVPEASTRFAMLQAGEADIIYLVSGELIDTVRKAPRFKLAPTPAGPWWIEFPGLQDPNNPFHHRQMRQAVSLALNRRALSQAETAGFAQPLGNFILPDWPGALKWPEFPHDVEQGKKLMAEAGWPRGVDVDWLTPLPPYFSLGERVISQLRGIDIRTKLRTMERATFFKLLEGGLKEWPGVQIILNIASAPGDWSSYYRAYLQCGGFSSLTCVPELDAKFATYEKSTDPGERQQLAEEIQRAVLENYYFVPVYRLAFVNALGPRIDVKDWQDIFATPQLTPYAVPWENLKVKD